MKLENVFLSASSVKEADGRTISLGIPAYTLMGNAANEVYGCINNRQINTSSVVILCGRGNGGDGYALACLMLRDGINVRVVYISPPKNEDSAKYADEYREKGGILLKYSENPDGVADEVTNATLVVDALHGVGYAGELKGEELILVELANSSDGFLLAVDIPTGISADGRVSANCIMADLPLPFGTQGSHHILSRRLLRGSGGGGHRNSEEILRSIRPKGCIIEEDILNYLPARPPNSNKGTFGTLLALMGSPNMPGAAYLSAMGALRSGVGLLKLTADNETLSILKTRLAEPVFVPFSKDMLNEQKYSAFLVGCGIGSRYDNCLDEVLKKQNQITIIDADGINYLATHINVLMEMQGEVILTPHPGEMARLIGEDIEYVNRNRIECARAFAMEFCCVLVLKGKNTVVASPNGDVFVNTTGNTSLSKGKRRCACRRNLPLPPRDTP